MKSIIISGASILLLFALVITGSLFLSFDLRTLRDEIEASDTLEEYKTAHEHFRKREKLYALAVGDAKLTEIRYSFDELITFSEFGTEDEAMAAKSRLVSYIECERRLSGFGIEALF